MNKNIGKSKPEVLLVTRPLTPPWDEASKNFAYMLAKSLVGYKFHIMVGEKDPHLPKNVTQHLIYSGSDWSILQKTKLVLKLFVLLKKNPQIGIVHFIFVPSAFNTKVLKNLIAAFPVKVVQTIACIPDKSKEKIKSLLFADKFIVYSKHTALDLTDEDQKKTSVIPPFIDFSEFQPINSKKRDLFRKKYNIEKEGKIILYPGEYSRLNALDTLWQGFLLAKSKIPNLKLFMACRLKSREDQKFEQDFQKMVASSNFSESVNFLGRVKDMKELYYVSDLTVFSVNSMEGKFDFPFVLLESLACGTPILTSDIAALPEIWDNDINYSDKFIFPAGETDIFAKKCVEILKQDREIYEKDLSNFVKSKFNKDKILKEYDTLYKESL